MLQNAAIYRDSICFFGILILLQQSFLYRDRSFFGSLTLCPVRFVVLSILMCVYLNNYVTTLTIVLRHCLCAASSKLCRDPVSMSRQYFCLFLLHQRFLYYQHFCRDRVLSPLNLISCCSFIFMLRHSLLVFVDFFYCDLVFKSRKDFLP